MAGSVITGAGTDDRVAGPVYIAAFAPDADETSDKRLSEKIAPWSINKEVLTWSMILKKAKLWRQLADDCKPLKTKASDLGRALTRDERHLAQVAATDEDWG